MLEGISQNNMRLLAPSLPVKNIHPY